MPLPRALLLDVDDTIIDTCRAMVSAATAAASALWREAPAERHAAFGLRFHDDPAAWFARFAAGEVTFERMRRERVSEAARALGLEGDQGRPGLQAGFAEVYEPAFEAALRVFPDVAPLLEAAREAGVPGGLLTNSAQAYTERSCGLWDWPAGSRTSALGTRWASASPTLASSPWPVPAWACSPRRRWLWGTTWPGTCCPQPMPVCRVPGSGGQEPGILRPSSPWRRRGA